MRGLFGVGFPGVLIRSEGRIVDAARLTGFDELGKVALHGLGLFGDHGDERVDRWPILGELVFWGGGALARSEEGRLTGESLRCSLRPGRENRDIG